MKLAGSRCLLIGGARRLGRHLALGLAAEGAAVCITSRGLDAALHDVRDELERAGAAQALAVRGDVSGPREAAALVAAGAEALGGLDVMVFAASGPFAPQLPETLDEAAWDASFDTIAKGFFFAACRSRDAIVGAASAAAADDAGERGVIVAMTDYLGLQPWARFAAHGAAKAAQIHLIKELARAWAVDRIRVCGVAPGPVDLADDEHRAATLRAAAKSESELLLAPAQVWAAVRLCLENEAMTGVNVIVDGGALLSS